MKTAIQTRDAPEAIGTYSQAVRADHTVYLSGQIGLDPATMQLAEGIDGQSHRVFRNLAAVAAAAGSSLDQDRKSTRLNSSHTVISYAVFCLKKKNTNYNTVTDSLPLPGSASSYGLREMTCSI